MDGQPPLASQFNNVHVDSDPGARGMMGANNYVEPPVPAGANSQGSYNNDMSAAFLHRKGPGQKVRPISAQTLGSSTWTAQ